MPIKYFRSLIICFLWVVLAGCGTEYGHYQDNNMIGTVQHVDLDQNVIEVDISEWSKRDIRGGIDDYGVALSIEQTDQLVIKNEDGTMSDIDQLKLGQKVLINPPKTKNNSNYEAREVMLMEMTFKEKYKTLLSNRKESYRTTVWETEEHPLQPETREKLMGLLSESPIGFGAFPSGYVVDFKKELEIEQFPVMLVFDYKGLVFKTYDADELASFFGSQ
ncbi:hypothetical protein D3P08_20860 [Paenibacillus nanensis]|uniref:DUF3221 domain-containing protein n=1 Tax=Paenibacillus nanensis TaxID=393251 RepID=A0A3A1UVI3_9BACL|nr:hypothetical protein [Paenibacillus nanensis]RIX50303.1 hypothetical protein D3P08_20860 [Paenibacillus nanensis]